MFQLLAKRSIRSNLVFCSASSIPQSGKFRRHHPDEGFLRPALPSGRFHKRGERCALTAVQQPAAELLNWHPRISVCYFRGASKTEPYKLKRSVYVATSGME